MTQVNGCLKWLLTVFNVHFAFSGGSIIVYTLRADFDFDDGDSILTLCPTFFYILGSIVMVIGILGAAGAYNESKACMVLFLVCMVLGSIAMLLLGSLSVADHYTAASENEAEYRSFLPLDKASMENKTEVERLQTKYQCCGLFGYEDWEGHVPDSCLCSALDEMEGKCHTIKDAGVLQQKKSVFIQACFPHTSSIGLVFSDVAMVITFTLAALGLLGMILSSIMIHQLRYPNRPVFLMSVPGFVKPPKYQELDNVLLPAKYY